MTKIKKKYLILSFIFLGQKIWSQMLKAEAKMHKLASIWSYLALRGVSFTLGKIILYFILFQSIFLSTNHLIN